MNGTIKNVLFFVTDQWRADTLGAMGHPSVPTPNIDAFATEAVTFSRHYCQALPCGPSRASMLTGLYLHNHRVVSNGTPLPAGLPNIALAMADAGYHPALFGYTDTPLDPDLRDNRTSDEWVCPGFTAVAPFLFADGFSGWAADLAYKGYEVPEDHRRIWDPVGQDYTLGKNTLLPPSGISAADTDTAWLTERLLVYLDAMEARPWFAHFNCLKPHPPLFAPRPYDRLVHPNDVPLPKQTRSSREIAKQHPWLAFEYEAQESRRSEYPSDKSAIAEFDEWDARRLRVAYYGNCSEVDAQFGRIIDRLKSLGVYDETLVIFCSDHGDQLGDNGFWGRRGPYDGNFHVPLIIRDPRPAADPARGSRVNAFTEHVDLAPTISEALGSVPDFETDGHSLVPFLQGAEPAEWRRYAHFAYDFRDLPRRSVETALSLQSDECHFRAIRGERWKYVEFPSMPPLLYDLENDPTESLDLAQDPQFAAVIEEHAAMLAAYRPRLDAPDRSFWLQPYGAALKDYGAKA
ncbi:MAG: sulfatase [Rhodospirillaceae bacterium]|nr:sulfatase [Rhodospirillaceae bacterium]